jgi:DNA-binding beta-propeller fold protein YncE
MPARSVILALGLSLLLVAPAPAGGAKLTLVATYETGFDEGAEIVSVQDSTARAVLSNSETGTVDLLDLSDPAKPRRLARFVLGLADGETMTSVAFHPSADVFLAAIQAASPVAPGRVEIRQASTGARLGKLPAGVGPDCVSVDPTGRYAVTANEGEPFLFDAKSRAFTTPPGSITLIRLGDGPERAVAVQIPLSDQTGNPGFVRREDGRKIEREVDWNGNGEIDEKVDFDGDGEIRDVDVVVGTCDGVEVKANETEGEVFLLPLVRNTPAWLEPEVVAFSPDGSRAWITLQENNGVAVLDTYSARIVATAGLGTTTHVADLKKDGEIRFRDEMTALREPDGIAVTPDGRYVVTADEGDTDPSFEKVKKGKPGAGGRTVTVLDARTGAVLGDTGGAIDATAAEAGVYPDGRSGKKGSEPEMIVTFEHAGVTYAAAGLERAGAIALVSLADPRRPAVVQVASTGDGGSGPEGLAVYRDTGGRAYLLSANEKNGTVSVFRID